MQTGVVRVAVLLFALLVGGESAVAQQMVVADRGLPALESPDRVRLQVVDREGVPLAQVKVTGLAASWLYSSAFRSAPFRTTPIGPLWTDEAGVAEFDALPGRIVSVLLERTRYAPRAVYPLRGGSAYTVTLDLGRTLEAWTTPEMFGYGDLDASILWSTFDFDPDPVGLTLPVLRAGATPGRVSVHYLPTGSLTFLLRNGDDRVWGRDFSVPDGFHRAAFGPTAWDVPEWSKGLTKEWRFVSEDGIPLDKVHVTTEPASIPSVVPVHLDGNVLRVGPIPANLAWTLSVEAPGYDAWGHYHSGRTTGVVADAESLPGQRAILKRRSRVKVRFGQGVLSEVPAEAQLFTFSNLQKASTWQELDREALSERVLELPDLGRVFAVAVVGDEPVGYLVHRDGEASYLKAARLTIEYTRGGVRPKNVTADCKPGSSPDAWSDPSETFFRRFKAIGDEHGVLDIRGLIPGNLYVEPHLHLADPSQATLDVSLEPGQHLTVRREIRADVQRLVRIVDATDGSAIGAGQVRVSPSDDRANGLDFPVDAQGEAWIGGLDPTREYTVQYLPQGPASIVGPSTAPWFAPEANILDPREEGALVVRIGRTSKHPSHESAASPPDEP